MTAHTAVDRGASASCTRVVDACVVCRARAGRYKHATRWYVQMLAEGATLLRYFDFFAKIVRHARTLHTDFSRPR